MTRNKAMLKTLYDHQILEGKIDVEHGLFKRRSSLG